MPSQQPIVIPGRNKMYRPVSTELRDSDSVVYMTAFSLFYESEKSGTRKKRTVAHRIGRKRAGVPSLLGALRPPPDPVAIVDKTCKDLHAACRLGLTDNDARVPCWLVGPKLDC